VKYNFSDMKNRVRRADYVSYQMAAEQDYLDLMFLAPGLRQVEKELNELLNDDKSVDANFDDMQFAMNAFLEDCHKNQELQYEYDQTKTKIREAIEQRQHEEDENELFRILQRDATEKQIAEKLFALEDMRFEMVSCPKKSQELTLQYEEEQKKMYFECKFIF